MLVVRSSLDSASAGSLVCICIGIASLLFSNIARSSESVPELEIEQGPELSSGNKGPQSRFLIGMANASTRRATSQAQLDENWDYDFRFDLGVPLSGNEFAKNSKDRWNLNVSGELGYPVSIRTQNGEMTFFARVDAGVSRILPLNFANLQHLQVGLSLRSSLWQFPESTLVALGPLCMMRLAGLFDAEVFDRMWFVGFTFFPFRASTLNESASSGGQKQQSVPWQGVSAGFEWEGNLGAELALNSTLWLQTSVFYKSVFVNLAAEGQSKRVQGFQTMIGALVGVSRGI